MWRMAWKRNTSSLEMSLESTAVVRAGTARPTWQKVEDGVMGKNRAKFFLLLLLLWNPETKSQIEWRKRVSEGSRSKRIMMLLLCKLETKYYTLREKNETINAGWKGVFREKKAEFVFGNAKLESTLRNSK